MDKGIVQMKKILSILLMLTIVLGTTAAAFAAGSVIVESKPTYKRLLLDVAVEGVGKHEFYASVDGSELLPISAKPIEADQIGHIVVVDLGWTWTDTINEKYVLIPAIQDYLSQLDSKSKVKFILAGSGAKSTSYMTVSEGYAYIANNLKCVDGTVGLSSKTAIDAALETAFNDAVQYRDGDPIFKTVFALVDPANSGRGMSATGVRDSYQKTGNSFPVLIATIRPVTYIAQKKYKDVINDIETGIKYYDQFARSNGSQLEVLDFTFVANSTFSAGYNVGKTVLNRTYYTLDLTPIHDFINYTKEANEISIYVNDSRGDREEAAKYEVSNNALPTPKPTPTPTPTPEATFTPTPTPIPWVVEENDSHAEAKRAIKRLQELYYLNVADKDLPEEFDKDCGYALMAFCDAHELTYDGKISIELYEFLMSDEAKSYPTPTPSVTVTVTPTPEPTPVPAIYIGSKSTSAKRIIKKLQDLYYLPADKSYDEWTAECMLAFQVACENNNISYEEEYVDDEMYEMFKETSLVPQVTATPTPPPVAEAEATIPPEGFKPGYTDGTDSNFVARMQIILQNLNLYTTEKQVGVLDQPTLEAIELYCAEYGVYLNPDRQYVERKIIQDILDNGPNRKAYVAPTPSASEKLTEFLKKDVMMLGDFHVQMWMLMVVILILLFVIILIIILSGKKSDKRSDHSMSVSMGGRGAPNSRQYSNNPYANTSSSYGRPSYGDDDATRPQSHNVGGADDDATVKLGSGINVTLNISGGPSSGVQRVLIGSKSFIIGRPSRNGRECDLALEGDSSVSRKHAALYYQDKQLFIRNLSSNGTRVNGQPLSDQGSSATSDETVPLTSGSRGNAAGFELKRGDIVEISGYRITVNW